METIYKHIITDQEEEEEILADYDKDETEIQNRT
jgi:DNA-directed RNA polymerase subunit H (RpoH/RPB5)